MRRAAAAVRAALLPAAAGLMAAAGQAPLSLWPLSLAGFALFLAQVAGASAMRVVVLRAWVAGSAYFAGTLFWIVEPFMVDAARDGWMAPFALVFMAAGMALFWVPAALVAATGAGRAARTFGAALGLVAGDLLRGYVLTGFPWALAGHVWIGTPPAQLAALGGPVALSALTLALAALPVAAARPRRRAAGAALAVLVLAAAWLAGQARLDAPLAPRVPAITVRLVQPNATQALKWQPGMWELFLERQLTATAAVGPVAPDVVVWPETSVPYLLEDAGGLLSEAAAAARGAGLVLGIQRRDGARYYNAVAAVDGQGIVTGVYDKRHLVPFGEYVPLGDLAARLAGIGAFAAQQGHGYSAGDPRQALLDLGRAGRVLPLVCYEAVFPQDLRAMPGRADWILQVTNDGWFGTVAGPYQHLAQARLRAIEQGLPLLRAANTGITAVIDARGRVVDALPLNHEGFIDAAVPPALPPTPYARFGDLPATMLLAGCIVALPLHRRRVSR